MAGMTHPEWRLSLINEIRSYYSEYGHASERLEAATASGRKDRISLWTGRKNSAKVSLDEAYARLPEVESGAESMDAFAFAKLLSEKPNSPKFLKSQTGLFEQE